MITKQRPVPAYLFNPHRPPHARSLSLTKNLFDSQRPLVFTKLTVSDPAKKRLIDSKYGVEFVEHLCDAFTYPGISHIDINLSGSESCYVIRIKYRKKWNNAFFVPCFCLDDATLDIAGTANDIFATFLETNK